MQELWAYFFRLPFVMMNLPRLLHKEVSKNQPMQDQGNVTPTHEVIFGGGVCLLF